MAAFSWHQTDTDSLGRIEHSISVFSRQFLNALHLISSCIRRFWWALTDCWKSSDASASSGRCTFVLSILQCTGDAVELFPSDLSSVWQSKHQEMSLLLEPLRSTNFASNETGLKGFMIRQFIWLWLNPVRHFGFNPDNGGHCHVSWHKRSFSTGCTRGSHFRRPRFNTFRTWDTGARIPKQLVYGELSQGARKVGGQCKCFKDSLKANLKDFNMDITTWENAASDGRAWWSMIHRGALHSEVQRSNAAKEKRRARKAEAKSLPLSGVKPVAGASMPVSVSAAISGHTRWMFSNVIWHGHIRNRIDEQHLQVTT